ncbi:hypothetical protein CK203_111347 [Vitis vinifera]|uniref:Uncharacterized protein n=1 Tax=Vitis vinifera TaxID=29760 RepID=A0A438DH49_VITVI|nr:hypothetical protein CK203_111347 [Vitis vinifera]
MARDHSESRQSSGSGEGPQIGDSIVRPLLIETRSAPTYYYLIGEIEDQIELPWYHDIYQFLSCGTYAESISAKDRRALRQLATRFVICGDALYRRSPDGLLLLCLDRTSADRVMREVHAGVYGLHMGGHMLALLPVEIEMRSLVALEQHVSEAEWVQSRYDQLSLLDEKRLRAADHAQAY